MLWKALKCSSEREKKIGHKFYKTEKGQYCKINPDFHVFMFSQLILTF